MMADLTVSLSPEMLREFTDPTGIRWRVWDINPVLHARSKRMGKRSSFTNVPVGWLCFECDEERRRLTPIPDDWSDCDATVLAALCRRADPVPRAQPDLDTGVNPT
jgi:hypothetical protein